ncbi:hypothetical protein Taro_018593, partial [Colocasia esculenta]|nr:hypothetical protein [Colocasia esculenta]
TRAVGRTSLSRIGSLFLFVTCNSRSLSLSLLPATARTRHNKSAPRHLTSPPPPVSSSATLSSIQDSLLASLPSPPLYLPGFGSKEAGGGSHLPPGEVVSAVAAAGAWPWWYRKRGRGWVSRRGCGEMVRLAPVAAASAQQRPLRLPSHTPPPGCSCSSAAALSAVRVCPSSAAAGSGRGSGVGVSSSAFFCPVALGTGRRRRTGAVSAHICFREESAPHLSLYLRLLLAAPWGRCCSLLAEVERRGSLGSRRKRTLRSVCCGRAGCGGQMGVRHVEQAEEVVVNEEDAGILDLEMEIYDFMQMRGSLGSRRKRTLRSVCCGRAGCGGQMGVKHVEQAEEVVVNDEDAGILDLEMEIYDFMQMSAKPSDFPSKAELIAAGRVDLVEAIAAQGGWLAYGWDLGHDEACGSGGVVVGEGTREQACEGELRADTVDSHLPETSSAAVVHDESSSGWAGTEIVQQQRYSYATGSAADSSPASSSGRPIETKGGEESGIEGILSRLEKERSFLYTLDSTNKEAVNGFFSEPKDYDLGSAGEIFSNGKINSVENLNNNPLDDYAFPVQQSTSELRNGRKERRSVAVRDQNQIHSRLQDLESELASVLSSLRFGADANVLHKGHGSSLKELYRHYDAWEFRETEIMNARDKLRSTKAKLAILEGKMALEIIEAQKTVDAKQERIGAAQRALRLLRTAYVIWPNSASQVLLAGSFDGWSSQRRMERSSTGMFSLYLKLYPGQYEIKFVVDGIWKVDPLRQIVYNNGFENNLLIIS